MLGWGIISTGLHPENKIAPAIARADGAELAAVYSRDRLRAEAFAERHGARTAYDDLDAMLADAAVDAVFIASPNSLHSQHGIKAAAAGKHVLVEKPMTTNHRGKRSPGASLPGPWGQAGGWVRTEAPPRPRHGPTAGGPGHTGNHHDGPSAVGLRRAGSGDTGAPHRAEAVVDATRDDRRRGRDYGHGGACD